MKNKLMLTTNHSQWVYGIGQYLVGLGMGFGLAESLWWLLLCVLGFVFCCASGWMDAKTEAEALR